MKKLCIYHANCADGFTAAWIVKRKFGNDVEFYPGFYQNAPPNVKDRDIILVDFSYKLNIVLDIAREAKSVTILDHHKSALDDLEGLGQIADNVELVLDMERSGAMITWDYYFPNEQCPKLVEHIQDRDLFRFELEGTQEIQSTVFSYPYEFEIWDKLFSTPIEELYEEGKSIHRKHSKDIKEFLEIAQQTLCIDGHIVPAVNVPYTMGSDAAHLLAHDAPFAAYYYDIHGYRIFGLRSIQDEGMDVQKIAVKYGGGGHVHASGFKIPLSKIDQFEVKRKIRETS